MENTVCGKYAGKKSDRKGFSLGQDVSFVLPDNIPNKLKPSWDFLSRLAGWPDFTVCTSFPVLPSESGPKNGRVPKKTFVQNIPPFERHGVLGNTEPFPMSATTMTGPTIAPCSYH